MPRIEAVRLCSLVAQLEPGDVSPEETMSLRLTLAIYLRFTQDEVDRGRLIEAVERLDLIS